MASSVFKGVVKCWDVISTPFTPNIEIQYNDIQVTKVKSSEPNALVWTLNSPCASVPFEGQVKTVDQLMKKIFTRKGDSRAIGYRKVLSEHVEKMKNGSSIVKKKLADDYTWFTHAQVDSMIEKVAHGLLTCGVKKGDRVTILMETRYEWSIAAQAILRIGATLSTLYSTLGTEAIIIALNELESTHLITSVGCLTKIQSIRRSLNYLTTVIVVDDIVGEKMQEWPISSLESVNLVHFSGFFNVNAPRFEGEYEGPDENTIAVIMYTSGSTGAPKGVILSHSSLLAGIFIICRSCGNVLNMIDQYKIGQDTRVFVSFLPLAHIFQFVGDMSFLNLGFVYGYSSPMTLLSVSPGLAEGTVCDIQLLKPHYIPCVPILIDRIRSAVLSMVQSKGIADYFEFLMDYKQQWNARGKATPIVDHFVASKIKTLFGGDLRALVVGGAPLSSESKAFMSKAGFFIMEAYAATESIGHGVMDMPTLGNRTMGIGYPMAGAFIKLVDWTDGGYLTTDCPNPRGEVHIGGKFISQGYFKQPEKTEEEFYEMDGVRWWRSGDIAEMMPDNSFKIIDRKKDLIKLSRGEYVSLGRIETALKSCPLVANICLYGAPTADYLVALIIPDEKWLLDTSKALGFEPEDANSNENLLSLFSNEKVTQRALEEIKSFLKKMGNFSSLETPRKIKLCSETWTPESGLLTSALKIRRKQIVDFYRDSIDQMYSS